METEIIKAPGKPNLQMTAIVVTGVIPTHLGYPTAPAPEGFCESKTDRKVTFIVDTETWECKGQLATNDPVLADEAWWAEQCQKVSDRVRAQIKNTAA